MKKILALAVMMFTVAATMTFAACEKYDDGRPSKELRDQFAKMYPDAKDVEWDAEPGYWTVSFETGRGTNRFEHEAWFDVTGNWIQTVTDYSWFIVPQEIKDYLKNSEYGALPLADNEVDYIENPSGSFYRFELLQNGREINVDVKPSGEVSLAQN